MEKKDIYKIRNRKQIASLILNICVVIMELVALKMCIRDQGITMFEFYTTDSNILALIICTIYVGVQIKSLLTPNYIFPKWIKQLKYTATCCLTITFTIVVTVLAPMMGASGYHSMLLDGLMLYHHLLCPLLLFITFIFFEGDHSFTFKNIILTLIPTVVYAIVTLTLNVVGIIVGPYPFLMVYQQSFIASLGWVMLIHGIALLIAWLLYFVSKKLNKNSSFANLDFNDHYDVI